MTALCSLNIEAQSLRLIETQNLSSIKAQNISSIAAKDMRVSTLNVNTNDAELKPVEMKSRGKAVLRAPAINTSETWGAWSDLGSGTYTHGNESFIFPGSQYSFSTKLHVRQSTTKNHDNLYQIKVDNAFGDNDLIFWWERNDRLATNELTAEPISASYIIDGYTYSFKSILIDNAIYYPARGVLSFEVWYCITDVNASDVYGINLYESVVLDNMPSYTGTIDATQNIYTPDKNKATFNIDLSDNIATIRYYSEPEVDADFSGNYTMLDEATFLTRDYSIVSADTKTLDIDISGYGVNFVYMQLLNKEGYPVYYISRDVVSTQPDERTWTPIGLGTYTDIYVAQGFFYEDTSDNVLWHVSVEQCDQDPTFYRLVNPYTNEYSPFRSLSLTDTYASAYESSLDMLQDYYIYFKADDLNKGTAIISYEYPTGIRITAKESGQEYVLFSDIYTTCSDDNKVAGENSTFSFPDYVDYTFTLKDKGNNVVSVNPVTANTTLRYLITLKDGTEVKPIKDVPESRIIDLNAEEGLSEGVEYLLVVKSYNLQGDERETVTYDFNFGYAAWELIGTGTYTYTAYFDTTCEQELYHRVDNTDKKHEQYKIENWLFSDATLIIDIPDVTSTNSDGYINVFVPTVDTGREYTYASTNYGTIKVSDVYTYSSNEQFAGTSYYNPTLGEFHLYNVYYVDKGYLGYKEETFKLDGFPNIVITDNDQTKLQSGYMQRVTVELSNAAYATYDTFDANEYTEETAIEALTANKNASRIEGSVSLMFRDKGEYILAVVAYNEKDEPTKTETFKFSIIDLVDLSSWTYIGLSNFVDGWILPSLTTTANTNYPWYVQTYVNNDNPNLIGLLNPYTTESCELGGYNLNTVVETLITIDISDPECVAIAEQPAGYRDDTYGAYTIGNYEGYFASLSYSKDLIKTALAEANIGLSTIDSNGVITLPHCVFGYIGSEFGHTWKNSQPGQITLPEGYNGVHDVIVDEDDAPVEYFNLQGVRVTNPEHGLFIRRQGNKTTKVIL